MPMNLSLLPFDEKNKIELDKQASYLVWQIKHAKVGPEEITAHIQGYRSEDSKDLFLQSVDKYKRIMGVK
jgi:hypothetical protein